MIPLLFSISIAFSPASGLEAEPIAGCATIATAHPGSKHTAPEPSGLGSKHAAPERQDPGPGAKQDAPPPLPPLSKPKDRGPTGVDPPSALVPGVFPADTDPKACEAWALTGRVHRNPDPAQRVSAFDLEIEVRYRTSANQTNDSQKPLRLRFLSPAYARLTTANQRELLRGPEGDYLIDPARHEIIRLAPSRENAVDLHQLNECVSLAQSFIALTDLNSLRIGRLSLLPGAPPGLPPAAQKRASELQLRWLDLRSPDFRLLSELERSPTPPSNLGRVRFGADPKTGEVEMVLVDVDSNAASLSTSAVLMESTNYVVIDGVRMAQQVKVYYVDENLFPRAFRSDPTTTLGILKKSVNLRPAFKPEDFLPR